MSTTTEIVQLSKYYKPYRGGVESVVADVAEGLGAPSTVVACYVGEQPQDVEPSLVRVVWAKSWGTVASLPMSPAYVVRAVQEIAGKIIHLHHPNPLSNVAVLLASLLGKDTSKLVVHWHSDIVKQKGTFLVYRPLMNWMLKKARAIVVTSDTYLEGSEQLRDYRHKAVVIPIGTDSLLPEVREQEVEQIRRNYGGRKVIFALGRHIYYKGFEYLIEAASQLEDVVVLIGGAGPDTAAYERKITSLGLADKVKLIGKIPSESLASYYAAADVFCLPSTEKSEAYGVVQLEAMSVGTPVVSTDIAGSGVPCVNQHGESGLVCSPRDSRSLAECLTQVLSNDKLRYSLSEGARARYERYFTKYIMVKKISELYSHVGRDEL